MSYLLGLSSSADAPPTDSNYAPVMSRFNDDDDGSFGGVDGNGGNGGVASSEPGSANAGNGNGNGSFLRAVSLAAGNDSVSTDRGFDS